MITEEEVNAVIYIQQHEINQLYAKLKYYKELLCKKPHKIKLIDSRLVIKIGNNKWKLSKYNIKCGTIKIDGYWQVLKPNCIRFQGHPIWGGLYFEYTITTMENNNSDSIVELYYQPNDTSKNGYSYINIEEGLNLKNIINSIQEFISILDQ
jgi:hypothetical protein